MALSASDIGRLKAAVPTIYRPHDVAGALADNFDSSAALQERERYNLGLKFASGDDADNAPSFILSGSAATARKAQIDKRNEEHRRDERTTVQRLIDALNERIAMLDAELRDIDARLEQIKLRRQQIGDGLEALDEIARRRARGEKLDPNNTADRELMKAAGLSEAEANGADYAAIIATRRRDFDREDDALETEWNAKMKRRDVVAGARADAVGARAELEGADGGEARVLAERRAQTVLGQQQLAAVAYSSTDAATDRIAADAIANTEREDRQRDSAALNRNAVAGNKDAVMRTDTNSFTP